MSAALSKRQISEVAESSSSDSKRAEKDKKGSKPGRKPLDTEPKNKRTAQNRAAQRAFRERKERKMKELEDKIEALQEQNKSAQTESEFLRLQVQTLMNELAKHRGIADVSDLKLPVFSKKSVPALSDTPGSDDASSTFSPHSSESTATLKSLSDIVNGPDSAASTKQQFAFEFPWSRKGSIQSLNPATRSLSSGNNVPGLSSDVSTTSSSESSPFDLYNADDSQDLPMFNKDKSNEQQFNFDENFNEGVSEFCNDLGTACGTKDAPVPKSKSTASTPMEPSKTLRLDSVSNVKNSEDPLAFLRDPNLDYNFASFDPSLAFNADDNLNGIFDDEKTAVTQDPLADLTTEESLYDPFGMFAQTVPGVSDPTKQPVRLETILGNGSEDGAMMRPAPTITTTASAGADNDSDAEVVPSTEGRLLKCTEIWDRITSHPKYADIDIDGLCTELRAKAKCSDKGVVIDYSDVNKVIMNSLPKP